jgi:uncharacterized protein (DUF488 family)
MAIYSDIEQRRAKNAKNLAAFGASVAGTNAGIRTIRTGKTVTIFTVGYERRDGDELMGVLRDHGIKALADVRQRPISRKPDFRATALREFCEVAGIEYQPWPMLGSTDEQRDELQASGNFKAFAQKFKAYAKRTLDHDLQNLALSVTRIPTALLCYERLHEDCHRSVIADLVGESIDATVIAIQ